MHDWTWDYFVKPVACPISAAALPPGADLNLHMSRNHFGYLKPRNLNSWARCERAPAKYLLTFVIMSPWKCKVTQGEDTKQRSVHKLNKKEEAIINIHWAQVSFWRYKEKQPAPHIETLVEWLREIYTLHINLQIYFICFVSIMFNKMEKQI